MEQGQDINLQPYSPCIWDDAGAEHIKRASIVATHALHSEHTNPSITERPLLFF